MKVKVIIKNAADNNPMQQAFQAIQNMMPDSGERVRIIIGDGESTCATHQPVAEKAATKHEKLNDEKAFVKNNTNAKIEKNQDFSEHFTVYCDKHIHDDPMLAVLSAMAALAKEEPHKSCKPTSQNVHVDNERVKMNSRIHDNPILVNMVAYLKDNPDCTEQEVAAAVGYEWLTPDGKSRWAALFRKHTMLMEKAHQELLAYLKLS